MKKWYDIEKQQIFCYLSEIGDRGEFILFEEAAKRCNTTVDELTKIILDFEKKGCNVFINYDSISANR